MGTRSFQCGKWILVAYALGCTGDMEDGPMSWEDFLSLAYREPDTGLYIVDGDEPAENEKQLRLIHDRYRSSFDTTFTVRRQPLVVRVVSGADDRWSACDAVNLEYCIEKNSFSDSEYVDVVSAMQTATADWSAAANVRFIHASNLDPTCSSRNGTTFNVRRVSRGRYYARAFYPSYDRRNRELLIDSRSFGSIAPLTLAGILRHELGHAIGFRHEYIRPEASPTGICVESADWRALTDYDSASVMHHPDCGRPQGDLTLSDLDRTGAAALYPSDTGVTVAYDVCSTKTMTQSGWLRDGDGAPLQLEQVVELSEGLALKVDGGSAKWTGSPLGTLPAVLDVDMKTALTNAEKRMGSNGQIRIWGVGFITVLSICHDRVSLNDHYPSVPTHFMNTEDRFHKYRLVVDEQMRASLFVDDQGPVISGSAVNQFAVEDKITVYPQNFLIRRVTLPTP